MSKTERNTSIKVQLSDGRIITTGSTVDVMFDMGNGKQRRVTLDATALTMGICMESQDDASGAWETWEEGQREVSLEQGDDEAIC